MELFFRLYKWDVDNIIFWLTLMRLFIYECKLKLFLA